LSFYPIATCHNPFRLTPQARPAKYAHSEAMSVLGAIACAVLFIGSAAAASSQTFAIYGGKRYSGQPSHTFARLTAPPSPEICAEISSRCIL